MEKITKITKNEGITLIALVITIIVLLILAGISISMLSGDNSILSKTRQARDDAILTRENEQIKLAVNSSRIDELGEKANAKGVRKYFKSQGDKVSVYQNDDEIEIEYLDTGHKYIVKANGEIVKQEGTDTEEKNVYYKIDGKTLYLSGIKKDDNYKEIENYYYDPFSTEANIPEWSGEIKAFGNGGYQIISDSTIEEVIVENRIQPINTSCWFFNCKKLNKIENIERIDTKYSINMNHMFYGCSSLTSMDLSNFNTSNVTSMRGIFVACGSLTNLDISDFDTRNTTDTSMMFLSCSSLKSLDIRNFNTSNVTNMEFMFTNCKNLTELDLSSFNTSNVTNMSAMFQNCKNLPTLNLSSFNTSNVTDMSDMFYNCTSLKSLNISNFNTSNVTSMGSMFGNCTTLTSLDLSNFNTSKVMSMAGMFNECNALTKLNLTGFNTSNVTDMSYMFNTLKVLETLDLSSFDTRNVTNFKRIFNGSTSLSKIYVGDNWNTEKNTEESNQVFPGNCKLPNFNKSNNAYRDLKWAYVGEGGYLSKK